jgi:enoyl-CoA hydratase/carnithine racemase
VFLGRRIPLAVALELTLTGDYIDAERALALGLVNKLTAPGDVVTEALSFAERIGANGPLAIKAIKKLVEAAAQHHPAEVWAMQDELRPGIFESADAKEGATAFIEKRAPVWQGR